MRAAHKRSKASGALLTLRRSPPKDAADRPADWFDTLLARLESEGMVAAGPDGRLRLPG